MQCQTEDLNRSCDSESDGKTYQQGCAHEHVIELVMCGFHAPIALAGRSWCAACLRGPAESRHMCPVVVRELVP
jgi:hypothetical protein